MAIAGRYEIISELGRGGMARVYLALDRGPAGVERLVVLKRILPELGTDAKFIKMFLNVNISVRKDSNDRWTIVVGSQRPLV